MTEKRAMKAGANRLPPSKIEAYAIDYPQAPDVKLLVAVGLYVDRRSSVIPLLAQAGDRAKNAAVGYLIEVRDTDDLIPLILDSIQDPRQKSACMCRWLRWTAMLNHRKELETFLAYPGLHPNAIRLALYTMLEEKNATLARRLAEVMDLEKMRKYLLYRKDWVCLEYLAELIPASVAEDWMAQHTQHFHQLRGMFLAQERAQAVVALPPPRVAGRQRARS